MNYKASSPEEYIKQLPDERKEVVGKLLNIISKNLPKGFKEQMSYGMPGWVVPHSLYPDGYHCDPKLPLPFINLASQKNFVALYHSGIYANPELHDWFVTEYAKRIGKFHILLQISLLIINRFLPEFILSEDEGQE